MVKAIFYRSQRLSLKIHIPHLEMSHSDDINPLLPPLLFELFTHPCNRVALPSRSGLGVKGKTCALTRSFISLRTNRSA